MKSIDEAFNYMYYFDENNQKNTIDFWDKNFVRRQQLSMINSMYARTEAVESFIARLANERHKLEVEYSSNLIVVGFDLQKRHEPQTGCDFWRDIYKPFVALVIRYHESLQQWSAKLLFWDNITSCPGSWNS